MVHYYKKGKYYRLQNPTYFDSKDLLVINKEESKQPKKKIRTGTKDSLFLHGN